MVDLQQEPDFKERLRGGVARRRVTVDGQTLDASLQLLLAVR